MNFRTSFVGALRASGYGLRNTQDGAHELYHALTCGIPLPGSGRQQREKLNDAIEELFPGMERWWNEVEARCVERLVCARLGREDELLDFDRALRLSIEEATHYDVPVTSFDKTKEYALKFIESKRAKAAVDLMLAYALKEDEA